MNSLKLSTPKLETLSPVAENRGKQTVVVVSCSNGSACAENTGGNISATKYAQAGNGLGSSASPLPPREVLADDPHLTPARARGNVASAQNSGVRPSRAQDRSQPGEPDIFTTARKIVIKEILDLLNGSVAWRQGHKRYLEKLTYRELDARRNQLKSESQRELFTPRREPLFCQLELKFK